MEKVKNKFTESQINKYEHLAKKEGLNNFNKVVKTSISNAKAFGKEEDIEKNALYEIEQLFFEMGIE